MGTVTSIEAKSKMKSSKFGHDESSAQDILAAEQKLSCGDLYEAERLVLKVLDKVPEQGQARMLLVKIRKRHTDVLADDLLVKVDRLILRREYIPAWITIKELLKISPGNPKAKERAHVIASILHQKAGR